jgi:CubicO group peptidase (beta-lactamase class C family)
MTRNTTLPRVVAAVTAAVVLTVGLTTLPPSPHLQPHTSGDAALARAVERTARDQGALDRVALAYVDLADGPDGTVTTGFGADDDTEFEIGSLTKTFTGNLLQVAVERGEVTPDQTLGTVLTELAGTPAGGVTLETLSNHTSGLPGAPVEMLPSLYVAVTTNRDPYEASLDELLAMAGRQELVSPGRYVYSNLGMSLLGHALARVAGTTYVDLLQDRMLDPLGMTRTRVVLEDADLDDPTTGWSASGIAQQPWSLAAFAPAGGIRSTVGDMARYVRALLDGTAPGAAAMDPHLEGELGAVAYAWLVLEQDDAPTLTLHNGQTGGFASYLALDRAGGRGAVVLSNTASQLPDVAVGLVENGYDR